MASLWKIPRPSGQSRSMPATWERECYFYGFASSQITHDEVAVTGDEQEVVVDELLADLLVHPTEGVVGAGEVTGQLGESILHQALNAQPLLLGDAGRKAETVDAAADSDPSGVDRGAGVNVPLDLGDIHVARVDRIRGDAVVLLNQRIKHIGKNLNTVRVCVTCNALL